MTRARDLQGVIEQWLADALAPRGNMAGYAVVPAAAGPPKEPGGGTPIGWVVVVSLRNPELGKGDLYVPIHVPILTLDQAYIRRIVDEALVKLDDQADAIRRAAMNGTKRPGPT
jgi:hypothetical protein